MGRARASHGPAVLTLQLLRVAQLFNSFDPAPFRERDLDPDADRYLLDWARELPGRDYAIAIILPDAEARSADAAHVPEAMRHHFAARLASEQARLRLEFWRGRISLIVGLGFLVGCLALREALSGMGGAAASILGEGLLIVGWVAMWGPLEIFLYGWWPIAGTCRILKRLSEAEIRVQAHAGLDGAPQ